MKKQFSKAAISLVLMMLLTFSMSILTSGAAQNFGNDHSGMQSHYQFEVMFDYDKKYKLHYGPQPSGRSAWMVSDTIKVTDGSIQSLTYTPDGQHIIIGDDEGRVAKINLTTKRKIWEVKPFDGETNMYVRINKIVCSPDGKKIAFTNRFQYLGEPKWFKIIDAYTGNTLTTVKKYTLNPHCHYQGKPTFLCAIGLKFSEDSRYLYALFENEKTGNWGSCSVVTERYMMKLNAKNGNTLWHYKVPVPEVQVPGQPTIPAFSCALPSPEFDVSYLTNYLAVGGCNGNIMILNKNTGREIFRIPSIQRLIMQKNLAGSLQVAQLHFSHKNPDMLYLSSGHSAATYLHSVIKLSTKQYSLLSITSDYVPIIQTSPDESYLATGGNALIIWNNRNGKALSYILFRPGQNVKHHFKPAVNPVYEEFAAIERHRGKGYLLLIHKRPRKNFSLQSGAWRATGIYVNERVAFFIRGRGSVQLGFKNSSGLRAPDKTYDMPVWQTSFRINYYVDTGGELYIKSQSGGKIQLYGGKTRTELNNAFYRNRLRRWGTAPAPALPQAAEINPEREQYNENVQPDK